MKLGILGGATLVAILIATTAISQNQLEPGERVFSTINVTGNERFRDGDVLATSGLRTGEPYTEADIVSAVEALEFTGEFRNVRIFSSGPALTISVEEEPDYSGDLTFGIGADSDIGIFGSVGLSLDNVLGGKTFASDLTFSKEALIASAALTGETFWPGERGGGVRLEYADFDYDNTLFDFQTASLQPFVTFGKGNDNFAGKFRLTGLWNDITSVDADASAIIQAEEGSRFVSGTVV